MSKSKLYKKLLELKKENERLKEENKSFTPKPKKKGGLFGHMGWFRRRPKRIDRIEDATLSECPICSS